VRPEGVANVVYSEGMAQDLALIDK